MKILRRKYTGAQFLTLFMSLWRVIFSPQCLLNWLLVKISLVFQTQKSYGMPLHVHIEPTAECDYRCVKCARHLPDCAEIRPTMALRHMEWNTYQRLLDEIGSTLLSVRLWHYGEPLLHPDLEQMIRYAKDKRIFVAVNTNLSNMDPDRASKLVASGLDYMIISFDGASESTYALLHGVKNFSRVRKNIQAIIDARREARSRTPLIELQFIVMKGNEHEIDSMRKLAKQWGVDKFCLLRLDSADVNPEPFEWLDEAGSLLPSDPKYRLDWERIRKIRKCKNPWTEALIRYSGIVLPCVSDIKQVRVMGRLFEKDSQQSFRSIWNGKAFMQFRKEVAANLEDVEICSRCSIRDNNSEDQIN